MPPQLVFFMSDSMLHCCIDPRQNAEARGWPQAIPEPRRFGGIEMRLPSIQIGVFPPHIGEGGYSVYQYNTF